LIACTIDDCHGVCRFLTARRFLLRGFSFSKNENPFLKAQKFDVARKHLYTTVGTTSYTIDHEIIRSLPQGTNQPVEKVLLQAPGVSQDSAASGLLHVRNDHANVQFRINGVMLPDGVTGFGSVLDTDLIGSLSLVTGALPAEFGMRERGRQHVSC
jgi:hypothetical protein